MPNRRDFLELTGAAAIEAFRFNDAANYVYRFVWHRGLFSIAVFVIVWGVLTWLTARKL